VTIIPHDGQNANHKTTKDRKSNVKLSGEHGVGFIAHNMTVLTAPVVPTHGEVSWFLER